MTADFQLTEPGVWVWGVYVIEEEADSGDDLPWYTLSRAGDYLWECETFEGAVAMAEKEAEEQ